MKVCAIPRTASEQVGQRVRGRLRRAGHAETGRTHRRGRYGLRTDRTRRARIGRTAARRTARSGDDALFLGSEFQGYSRADQREYQHRAGAHALCAHQPAENDQRKKSDSELTLHNNPPAGRVI